MNIAVPFNINGTAVATVEARTLGFVDHVEMLQRATDGKTFRQQLIDQIVFKDATGKTIPHTYEDISTMPATVAFQAKALLNKESDTEAPGKFEIIRDGNGLEAPILIRLGTPVKVGEVAIQELEIQLTNLMQAEPVIAAGGALAQAIELLRIAKPVMPSNGPEFQQLPDTALRQINTEDGYAFALSRLTKTFFVLADE